MMTEPKRKSRKILKILALGSVLIIAILAVAHFAWKFSQDPRSKVLIADFLTLPGLVPLDPCCVRVTNMHNTWRFTPLGDGQIQVEWVANYDPGIPYWMFNALQPVAIPQLRRRTERVFNLEKYRHQQFAWLKEG